MINNSHSIFRGGLNISDPYVQNSFRNAGKILAIVSLVAFTVFAISCVIYHCYRRFKAKSLSSTPQTQLNSPQKALMLPEKNQKQENTRELNNHSTTPSNQNPRQQPNVIPTLPVIPPPPVINTNQEETTFSDLKQEDIHHGGLSQVKEVIKNDGQIQYQGNLVNGLLQGPGQITHPDGTIHIGIFINSMLNGSGNIKHGSQLISSGMFQNNQLNGKGLIIRNQENGQTIEQGKFENDNLVKGSKTYPDGSSEEGTFFNSLLSGDGIKTKPDGKKYSGIYEQGELQDGPGFVIYPNQFKVVGSFVNGELEGDVVLQFASGNVHPSYYVQGKPSPKPN